MRSTSIAATALTFTSALAQSSSVTSLFLPGSDQQALVASVVGSHASTVTYAINCPAGTDQNDCGFPSAFTMTFGPSFYEAQTTDAPAFSYSVHCDLDGTTAATCTESAGGSEANFPGVSTETLTGTDAGVYQAVTITAGLENLKGATAAAASASASATGASASATGASGSATGASATGSTSSGTSSLTKLVGTKTTASGSGTATGSSAATQSTGAAGSRTAFGMSAAGVVGVALAAFAL